MSILKKNRIFSYCTMVLCLGAFSSTTVAANKVDFAGFATLAYSKTLTGQDDTEGEGKGKAGEYYGMSKDGDARQLSLLGLRGNVAFDDYRLTLTAQAVMYGNDDYKPKFDWIYADYELGAGWSIAAGRTRTPLFMYSAYQDVSYAYTWLKPPFSVYGIPQFKSVDGVKLRHQSMLGDWSSDMQIWYGTLSERLTENGLDSDLELKDIAGVSWDIEHNWLRLHTAYMFANSRIDLSTNKDLAGMMAIFDGLEQFFASSPSIQSEVQDLRKQLEWEGSNIHFGSLGLGMDFGYIFLNTEATYINVEETVAAPKTMQSYYLTLGTRPVKDWTFSLTLIRDRDREHKSLKEDYAQVIDAQVLPVLNAETSSPDLDVQEAATNLLAGINGNNLDGDGFGTGVVDRLQRLDTKGLIISTRWDFHRSASAKLEYLAEERRYGGSNKIYRPQGVRIGVDVVF